MKFKRTLLVLVSSIIGCHLLTAQQPKPPRAPEAPVAPQAPVPPRAPGAPQAPHVSHAPQPGVPQGFLPPRHEPKTPEVRFDLNFPGGPPGELVALIEKASGEPLNAVIPSDLADMELPPLKMKQVTVAQLFEALMLASMKRERYVSQTSTTGSGERRELVQFKDTSYGFRTQSPGPNAVWYFFYERPHPPSDPPHVSRFYNLDTAGKSYSVQDITTAVKTGWELLGIKEQPTLKYHPETKLLIAVGQHEHLQLIDSVLRELGIRTDSMRPPTPGAPKKDGDSPTK